MCRPSGAVNDRTSCPTVSTVGYDVTSLRDFEPHDDSRRNFLGDRLLAPRNDPSRMKEEFLITLRARKSARPHAIDAQTCRFRGCAHPLDSPLMQRSVAHDPATADISAVELKLRLHQDQVLRLGTRRSDDGRKHLGDGNERNIHGHEVGGLGNLLWPKIARIRLDLRDASVVHQTPRHLLRRHINRINAPRGMLQQAIRKSSGGRAYIEAGFPVRIDSKILERALQLQATAARVFSRSSADFNARVTGDLRAGLIASLAVHADFSSENHGLRLFARFGEAAFDDQQVEPLFCGFGFGWQDD